MYPQMETPGGVHVPPNRIMSGHAERCCLLVACQHAQYDLQNIVTRLL